MSDVDDWYRSGESVTVNALALRPEGHPVLDTPLAIARKQATAYLLRDLAGRRWFVKKFNPGRVPSAEYLVRIRDSVPSMWPFRAASARTVVGASQVVAPVVLTGIAKWLDGTVLMPKVPGSPWTDLLEGLNGTGGPRLDWRQRLVVATRLAIVTAAAEDASVSHRDYSGGNIHVEAASGRIHLIDWDSAFVPDAPFQPNTVLGSEGYMAPWLSDAKDSWATTADRFALAVMITEVLTVDQSWHLTGDGALFRQDEFGTDSESFQRAHHALSTINRDLAILFERAWKADTFARCPAPFEWAELIGPRDPSSLEEWQRAKRESEAARAWRMRGERTGGRLSMRWLTHTERGRLARQLVPIRRTQVVRRAILSGDDGPLGRVAAEQSLESLGLRPSELMAASDGARRQAVRRALEEALASGTPADLLAAWHAAAEEGLPLDAGVEHILVRTRLDEVSPVAVAASRAPGPAPASPPTSGQTQPAQMQTNAHCFAMAEAEAALESALASGDPVLVEDASTETMKLGSAHLLDDPRVRAARVSVIGSRRLSKALSEAAA